MSHELPEDLDQWPRDAYQLLGVSWGIKPRELRRVYTRLIRRYKPEQHPEHFRRIREAYETVARHAEMFGDEEDRAAPTSEQADRPEVVPMPRSLTDVVIPSLSLDGPVEAPLSEPREERPEWPGRLDPDTLWQRACDGDEEAAYRGLVELEQMRPGQMEMYLRLYWLLKLAPELDPQRTPCDWLARGLQSGGHGQLRELYRREIADDPREGVGERCARLLQQESRVGLITDLAEWRWQAAGRLERTDVIGEDLEALRPRVQREDDETWLRLLVSALEQLLAFGEAGSPTGLLAWRCLEEIKKLDYLQARAADVLDRVEYLREVAAAVPVLSRLGVPGELRRLIPLSWSRPFPEVRPLLLAYLAQVDVSPPRALNLFDRLHKDAAPVLSQFGQLLAMLSGTVPESADEREPDAVRALVQEFVAHNDWSNYAAMRGPLLNFCLDEAVAPETVAEAAQNLDLELAHGINGDWSLRYVWLACRLYRA